MPDYMFLLESRLSPEQRAAMMRVQELSAAMGFNVYLTGGTVRDLVMGASLRDLDFSVEGNPSKIARELEKGGAKILSEDEKFRIVEILFAGDCDGSISAARDDHYVRPGTRPELLVHHHGGFATARLFFERDRHLAQSGFAGIVIGSYEWTLGRRTRRGARAYDSQLYESTGAPASCTRFAARMGFKIEARTQEWFDLAIERDLHHTIAPEDAGAELRAAAREERPAVVLKAWEEHDLLEAIHPILAKRRPNYEAIARLMKVREDLFTAGVRPKLATPMMLAILGRLKDREQSSVLSKAGFRSAEADAILNFEKVVLADLKELIGRKLNAPLDAYKFLERLPVERVAYLLAESSNSAALSKIRAYLHKWRPIRAALPMVANELEALGYARGAKFDAIVEQVFGMQLTGRGKTPEERIKTLRKLSGIKEQPKKKEKEKKPAKGPEKPAAIAGAAAAPEKGAPAKPAHGQSHKNHPVMLKQAAKHKAAREQAKHAPAGKKSGRK